MSMDSGVRFACSSNPKHYHLKSYLTLSFRLIHLPNGDIRIHLLQLSEVNEITHAGCFRKVPSIDTGLCLTLVMYYQHDNKDLYLCLSSFNHYSFSCPYVHFSSHQIYTFSLSTSFLLFRFSFAFYPFLLLQRPFC